MLSEIYVCNHCHEREAVIINDYTSKTLLGTIRYAACSPEHEQEIIEAIHKKIATLQRLKAEQKKAMEQTSRQEFSLGLVILAPSLEQMIQIMHHILEELQEGGRQGSEHDHERHIHTRYDLKEEWIPLNTTAMSEGAED